MADSRQKEATASHGISLQKDTGVGQQSAPNDPDAQGEQPTAQDGPASRIVLERGISAHMQQTISPDVAGSPRNALPLCTAPPSTQVSHDQASNGYFANRALHSTPSRKSLRMPNGSTQSSSGSLQTLAEHEGADGEAYRSVQRAASTRLPHSPKMGRRHSKSASMSQPVTMFPTQATRQGFVPGPHPGFPDQTYASLSPDPTFSSRPNPSRSRSSHATSEMARLHAASNRESAGLSPFSRTEHSTPLVSPGLFSPIAMRAGNNLEPDAYRSASPQLHHLQVPKETHAAEIDHDMISGNKMVNAYEIIRELGRGEHGKVKLGRDNVHDLYVAIKIVARFSNKNRRLGRLDEPQDQTRREVAILKRARHPNVVSLIEVIDDPSKKKVYLILEYVERGEIKWRKRGVPQICKINNARFESEKSKGISLTLDPSEHDRWLVKSAAIKHDALDRQRQNLPHQSSVWHFAGDVDEENELERTASQAPSTRNTDSAGPSRSQSEDDYALHPTQSLAGSMYGPYMDEVPNHRQDRKYSLAISHMSSEFDFEESVPEMSYVPALTQDEARRAFRDTLLGLEFLHAIGIIHRDIKPSNLLVASDGAVKISDFGVSYFGRPMTEQEAEAKGNAEKEDKPLDDERELARSVGTQAFWAPELCYEDPDVFIDGKVPKITGAIDLWALGVTLYAMIYARLPFYATETLGLHAAVCTTDVTLPKTRLVPVDTTNEAHVTHSSTPINSNKRLDFELKFETVPDNLRDLMAKLLTRDPANRITIAQAKQHPWVLENIPDVTQFLEPPNVVAEGGDTNITEPDEKDIKEAVVKRSFLGDMARTATKAINSLFKQTSSGRRRGNTLSTNTAASTSSESIASPAGSSTSTVGKQERGRDARRTSLPPDELLSALHRSREVSGHPLAQSQTASPDNEEIKFDLPEQTLHPEFSPAVSPRIAPSEARPKLPDRGLSALSTADSTRTIRPSQGHSHGMLDVPGGTPPPFDAVLTGKLQNWWENTKTLTRLASRDRRARDLSRSPSMSRASSESEPRPAQATLAISHTQATGTMETPDALKLYDTDSRQGSQSEDNKIGSSASSTTDLYHRAPTSAPSAFLEAQEINQRRLIREAQEEAAHSQTQSDSAYLMKSPAECPPSPDDLRQDPFRAVQTTSSVPPFTQEFEHNILSTTASSVEDFTNSSVTQSTSNPSFIATSGASSPPEEAEPFLSKEYTSHYAVDHTTDPDYLRTEDTIIEHGRPRAHTTPGKAVEQQESDYHDEGDDENSSDEDDAVLMMGPKKKNAV